jgi:hypothetical protein
MDTKNYVKVGEKLIKLTYDFSSLARLEEECGINIFEANALKKIMAPSKIRDLVWAGLLSEMPDLTRNEAAKFIKLEDLSMLAEAIVSALTEAMPKDKKKK